MFKLLTSDQWNKENYLRHTPGKESCDNDLGADWFRFQGMQERRCQPNVYLTKNVALTPRVG